MNRALRIVCLALVICATFPAAAHAQIYSWRDTAGTAVLSNRPKDGAELTLTGPHTAAPIRTTHSVNRRAAEFEPLILEHAGAHGVSADLVRAVIQAESAFNPRALSRKGAMGLMQLMPATANDFGVRNPYDPGQNIRAGVAYLKNLLARYSHNEDLALAAYNAGPEAVKKYGAVPPYSETRDYIARIKSSGSVRPVPTKAVYPTVEVVDGREVTRFSNR